MPLAPIDELALSAASGGGQAGLVLPDMKFVEAPADFRKMPQWSRENYAAFLEWKDKLAVILQQQN